MESYIGLKCQYSYLQIHTYIISCYNRDMNANSLETILKNLSQSRPIFHSEADFQFSLATAIKSQYPNAELRLERPYPHYQTSDHTIYLDLLIILGHKLYPIELKYKTASLSPSPCLINSELYQLKHQGARNANLHHFLHDIERLEYLSKLPDFDTGFTIWLTNDPIYWQKPRHQHALFAEHSLHDGARISSPSGTDYTISWQNYSQNLKTDSGEPIKKGNFRYALLVIK